MLNVTQHNKLTAIFSWCLYDWACAAFSIIVTTFVFSTYFTTQIAENQIIGTYQWANATSLAGFLMALLSPLLGAIADHGGQHKRWLFFFTWLSIIATALLWFAYPNHHAVYFTLGCVVVGTLGYEIAQVFYNAFLPTLAPKHYLGRVSGWGWGAGYLGGIVALTIALVFFVNGGASWLDIQTAAQVRICGPFVALWYAIFSIPFFLWMSNIASPMHSLPQAARLGARELMVTLKRLPSEKNILLYLVSHMFYADGLNTLFAFGGIYAAGTFGLSFSEVLLFGITMNITAGIGAILLGWVDDYLGSKRTVLLSLFFMMIFGTLLLCLQHKYAFWSAALLLCIFVGPVQSASRTLMVRLIAGKGGHSAEMFGLYALSGRVTAFIGPWLLGVLTLAFDSQRAGMATVIVFFLIGALLLLKVDAPHHEGH